MCQLCSPPERCGLQDQVHAGQREKTETCPLGHCLSSRKPVTASWCLPSTSLETRASTVWCHCVTTELYRRTWSAKETLSIFAVTLRSYQYPFRLDRVSKLSRAMGVGGKTDTVPPPSLDMAWYWLNVEHLNLIEFSKLGPLVLKALDVICNDMYDIIYIYIYIFGGAFINHVDYFLML